MLRMKTVLLGNGPELVVGNLDVLDCRPGLADHTGDSVVEDELGEHLHVDVHVQVSHGSVEPGRKPGIRQYQSYLFIPDLSPLCRSRLVEEWSRL